MWVATSVTFIFVFDMVAQDMRNYPDTMVYLRTTWTNAYDGMLRCLSPHSLAALDRVELY